METLELSDESKKLITRVEGLVTPEDIDVFAKQQAILDKSYRLRTIVEAWKDQQNQDRSLRKLYAKILLSILSAEVIVSITAFFMIGFGSLKVDVWVANLFFAAVFTQAAALVLAIVKYLFPQTSVTFLKLLERL